MSNTNDGRVVSVRGQVVEVEFPQDTVSDKNPSVYSVLETKTREKVQLQIYGSSDSEKFFCLCLGDVGKVARGDTVAILNESVSFPVGAKLLGRAVDVFGRPQDGKGSIVSDKYKAIHSSPLLTAKVGKQEILVTGIKVLDLFAPILIGGKMGLFGGAGVGKTLLLTEILNNVVKPKSPHKAAKAGKAGVAPKSHRPANSDNNVCVFAGVGERSREGLNLYNALDKSGVLAKSSLIVGPMGQNPAHRFLSAYSAVTLAEYFRDELGKDVIFFVDNIFRFAQAGRELSTLTNMIPSEDGYQSTLESEMANLHERLTSSDKASITSVEAVYVPADDLLDHGVQTVFPYLDSVVVLSRDIYQSGIMPAIDIVASTSSALTPEIVGESHYKTALEAKSVLKLGKSLQRIVSLVGESELSEADRKIYKRAQLIVNYMTQRFFVAEDQGAQKGVFVPKDVVVKDVAAILAGDYDDIAENRLLYIRDLKDLEGK